MSKYGIDLSTGPDYRRKMLKTDTLDFNELNNLNFGKIGGRADVSCGSSPFDGVSERNEKRRRR